MKMTPLGSRFPTVEDDLSMIRNEFRLLSHVALANRPQAVIKRTVGPGLPNMALVCNKKLDHHLNLDQVVSRYLLTSSSPGKGKRVVAGRRLPP